jgi:hypothetical protein
MTDHKRILVIGPGGPSAEAGAYEIRSFSWVRIAELHNIRDFTHVILNLMELPPLSDSAQWARIMGILKQAPPALGSTCRMLILGDPRLRVSVPINGRPLDVWFLSWADRGVPGIEVISDGAAVESLRLLATGSDTVYLDRVKQCPYTITAVRTANREITATPLLQSLDRRLVAFRLAEGPLSDVTFYPHYGGDADETVRLALHAFCEVAVGPVAAPAWVESLSAPGQDALDTQIAQLEAERTRVEQALKAAEVKRSTMRAVLRVLFEQGDVLETEIRSLLRRVGADVREPVERNKEDGWLSVHVDGVLREGVLELKGTKKDQFTEEGVRQLVEWVRRGIEHQKDYTGIFIGAHAVDRFPTERPDPFSDSWRRSADRFGLVALTTWDLYRAFELIAQGTMTKEDFWRSVFHTTGVYRFP